MPNRNKNVAKRESGSGATFSTLATLDGKLPARQQSELIQFIGFAPTGLVCLYFALAFDSILAGALAVGCLSFLAVMTGVRTFSKNKEASDPVALILTPEGGVSLEGHIRNPVTAALALRRQLLGRTGVPIPDGEMSNDAAGAQVIVRYPEDTKQERAEEIRRLVEKHDLEVIRRAEPLLRQPSKVAADAGTQQQPSTDPREHT